MKRFIIIGLGNFGRALAVGLGELGHDVIAVDTSPENVDALGSLVARAFVGDATRREILEEAGARNAHGAVVSTGSDIGASILSLIALRDLGVKKIFVKVISEDHERICSALGATESIFPERQAAQSLASRMTAGALVQYVQLGPKLSMQEMPVPTQWYGKSLRELSLPKTHRIQVVALHDFLRDEMHPVPAPDRLLTDSDTLLVAGEPRKLAELASMTSDEN